LHILAKRERSGTVESLERSYPTADPEKAADALRDLLFDGWEVELERVEVEERRGLIFSGSRIDLDAGYVLLPLPEEIGSYRCLPAGCLS
jgi:hypothetical protein